MKILLYMSLIGIMAGCTKQVKVASHINSNLAEVVIIAGQSNASGRPGTNNLTALPAGYTDADSNIQVIWDGDYSQNLPLHYEDMHTPLNTTQKSWTNPSDPIYPQAGWGIEQTLMRALKNRFRKQVYLIKNGSGGSPISTWDASSAPQGFGWVALKSYIDYTETYLPSIGKTPHYTLVWLQGESDCSSTLAPQYEGKLRTLMSNVRGLNSHTANMKWINVKLSTSFNSVTYYPVINAAFDKMVSENPSLNYTLTPESCNAALGADLTHYTAQGYLNLGTGVSSYIISNNLITE